jgi:glycosyltransferase involved in cell wall biosynthesis
LPFVPIYPAHVHVHGVFVERYLRRNAEQFDIVHAHSPLVPPIRGPWPVVTTLHSLLTADARATRVEDVRSLLIRLQAPISVYLERQLLRRSAGVVVVNPLTIGEVTAMVGGRVAVRFLPNAVDIDRFVPGPATRAHRLVLAVGRLVHGKGFEDLLTAWAAVVSVHPDARLTIVGDGLLRGRLVELAASLGLAGTVRFAGVFTAERHGDLLELYQTARAVVQPSHHEGLSTVLLEAMACATPVVATAVGAHPTLIADGVNGILVPPQQPLALAQAVSHLMADPVEAAELGRKGRATVVHSYSWAHVADSYVSLYEELLAGAHRAN